MKTQIVTQIECKNGDSVLVCWVDGALSVGQRVSFKHDDRGLWEVLHVYATMDITRLKRGWNNNI